MEFLDLFALFSIPLDKDVYFVLELREGRLLFFSTHFRPLQNGAQEHELHVLLLPNNVWGGGGG